MTNSMKMLCLASTMAIISGCSGMSGGSGSSNTTDIDAKDRGTVSTGLSDNGSRIEGQALTNNLGVEVDEMGIPVERTIYFKFNSDRIDNKYANLLQSHAEYLRGHKDTVLVLKGHTDSRGTREYNLGLSERRAGAISRFMAMMEVPSNQIEIVAYGEGKPAAIGHTEDAYSKNRRVVLDY